VYNLAPTEWPHTKQVCTWVQEIGDKNIIPHY
jgi:hypothetical protein